MSDGELTADDVPALTAGAMLYSPSLAPSSLAATVAWLTDLLERGGPLRLMAPRALPPDVGCAAVCVIGSGAALADLPPTGDEFVAAVRELERLSGREVGAVLPLSAATVSALVPAAVACQLGVPLLDADGMGRTFALIHHTSMHLAGLPVTPLVVAGATGESISLRVPDAWRADALLRAGIDALGGWGALAAYPSTAGELATASLPGTVSRLVEAGRVLLGTRDPDAVVARLAAVNGCRRVGRGRIVALEHLSRPTDATIPTHPSSVVVEQVGPDARQLRLELRSEVVAVFSDGSLTAAAPDLITLLDVERGVIAPLDSLWPGDLVDVLVIPAHPVWYSAEALTMVGPASHGITLDHPRRR
ncbi:MAG: DUF917 domain-containing protein [Quadrisphaera sp.]